MQSNDAVTLVLGGPAVSEEKIRSLLGVEPESSTVYFGETCCRVSLSPSADESALTGEFTDWCGLLYEKSSEIQELVQGGYAYLECTLVSLEVEIDTEVIKQLALLGISLHVCLSRDATVDGESAD